MVSALERHQVWLYLLAILVGIGVGALLPERASLSGWLLWPLLAVLLYMTFIQVPLVQLPRAFRDGRFLCALLVGNFVFIPLLVAALLVLLPSNPALKLGVVLVLLVPCTDWFITFTQLGRGDAARAITATPVLLLGQLLLLPLYVWLFIPDLVIDVAIGRSLLMAFCGLILAPLALAWFTEYRAQRTPALAQQIKRLQWLPIPLLALVLLVISASQAQAVMGAGGILWHLLLVFVLFLIGAAIIAVMLGRVFQLAPPSSRTLVFSLSTRNSFVVLPLAAALPELWGLAVIVIVFQSLVELFGMTALVKLVPQYLVPDRPNANEG